MRIPDATERKVLVMCFGIAGLICSAPGDFVSAGGLWVITFVGYVIHRRLLEKEAKVTAAGSAAPVTAGPSEVETEGDASPPDSDADRGKAA